MYMQNKQGNERGFGTAGLVVVIAVVALGAAAFFLSSGGTERTPVADTSPNNTITPAETNAPAVEDTESDVDMNDEMMAENEVGSDAPGIIPETETEMDDSTEVLETSEATEVVSAGSFLPYSEDKLALADNGDVVLFFHASWCPSCRGLESDINANLSNIPENVHILQIDFDSEAELKKKYGVVRQHTLVQVDSSGSEIKKLTGLTNTLNQVVSQI